VKDEIPDWKVQTSDWNVEDSSKWRTENTDNFFYEIEEKRPTTKENSWGFVKETKDEV